MLLMFFKICEYIFEQLGQRKV